MARKKVTSSDVAEKAGVSQATVSMVLNHKYNVSFSRETVEKVESAARELGYQLPGHKNKKENKKEKMIVVFCPTITSRSQIHPSALSDVHPEEHPQHQWPSCHSVRQWQ